MATWRKLHNKIVHSLDFHGLPDDFTRLVWALLPLAMDSAGRCLDNTSLIKARIMPLREDVTGEQMRAALDAITAVGMTVGYRVNGIAYLYMPNWERYQGSASSRKEGEPEFPDPSESDPPTESPTYSETNSTTKSSSKSETNSVADVDVDVDVDVEKRDGAVAPARRKRRQPVPPAVAVMRDEMQRYPLRATYQEIADAVGEDQAALDRWREVCRQWARRGYNVGNVEGLLDAWNAGGLAPRKGGSNHSDPPQTTLDIGETGLAYGELERAQERQRLEQEVAT